MANIPLKTIKFPGLDDTYTVPQVDNTLSVTGAAADAKKTGDELSEINERIDDVEEEIEQASGLSDEAKEALLACFRKVAWATQNGADYVDVLEDALYEGSAYPKIIATYAQTPHTVRTTDNINSLKNYLTVVYYQDRHSTGQVISSSSYFLSGTLEVGSNIITVSYDDLHDTFEVEAKAGLPTGYTAYDYIGTRSKEELQTIPNFKEFDGQLRFRIDKNLATQTETTIWGRSYTDLWELSMDFYTQQHTIDPSIASTSYNVLFGGRSTDNQIFGFYQSVPGNGLSCQLKGLNLGIGPDPQTTEVKKVEIIVDKSESKTIYRYSGIERVFDWTGVSTPDPGYLSLFNNTWYADERYNPAIGICNYVGIITIKDPDTLNIIDEYVPAVRTSDNAIGLYDTVNNTFYTTQTLKYATVGNSYCIYKVGNWG